MIIISSTKSNADMNIGVPKNCHLSSNNSDTKQITMAQQDKEQQKKLITEIMNDDAKDGLYISPTKSNTDMNIGFTDQWKDTPLNIGGQTKQTAVEWLYENLTKIWWDVKSSKHLLEQAKQMEKEQIINAASLVLWNNSSNSTEVAEQYYNETYGQ